jgi:Flp pilus assembly pilin Flp
MRIRSLHRDERGVAVTEFALLVLPMSILLMGLLDLGYMMYVRSVLQGAVNEVARAAVVETPNLGGVGTTEEQIEAKVAERFESFAASATVTVDQEHFSQFSSRGRPEKLITDLDDDGEYDEDDDCFEDMNESGEWDSAATGTSGIGGAEDVVIYRAHMSMDRILPVEGLIEWLPTSVQISPTYEIDASAAVRNQPFADQEAPPIVCPTP